MWSGRVCREIDLASNMNLIAKVKFQQNKNKIDMNRYEKKLFGEKQKLN